MFCLFVNTSYVTSDGVSFLGLGKSSHSFLNSDLLLPSYPSFLIAGTISESLFSVKSLQPASFPPGRVRVVTTALLISVRLAAHLESLQGRQHRCCRGHPFFPKSLSVDLNFTSDVITFHFFAALSFLLAKSLLQLSVLCNTVWICGGDAGRQYNYCLAVCA